MVDDKNKDKLWFVGNVVILMVLLLMLMLDLVLAAVVVAVAVEGGRWREGCFV